MSADRFPRTVGPQVLAVLAWAIVNSDRTEFPSREGAEPEDAHTNHGSLYTVDDVPPLAVSVSGCLLLRRPSA